MRHLLRAAALAVAVVACSGDEASAFGRRGGRGGAVCYTPCYVYPTYQVPHCYPAPIFCQPAYCPCPMADQKAKDSEDDGANFNKGKGMDGDGSGVKPDSQPPDLP